MPNCKNCNQPFALGLTGKKILATLEIPEPQVCDRCAVRLLMAFRNERTFYPRQCDSCQKNLIAMYPAGSPFTVYCHDCWWGDGWEGATFGLDYQGPEKFFSQLKELQLKVPREALVNLNSANCDYCNHIRDSKSCYMCSLVSDQSEECFHCYWIVTVKDSADCYYGRDDQRCYFCVVTEKSYGCSYLLECENCLDCHYGFDLKGCKNCFLSTNLRNQQYVFANKQLTAQDYEKKIQEINRGSWSAAKELRTKWQETISRAIHKYSYQTKCENSTGDNLQNCVNAELCYNCFESENIYNAPSTLCAKNIFNGFAVGTQPVEWGSNIAVIKGGTQVISCYNTAFSSDIYFCENMVSCLDCIGCIGLHKKQYYILNKQYSPEEYKKIKSELLAHWRKTGALGEFFPAELSTFKYNETAAQDFYPLVKEEALKLGYRWEDNMPGTFGKESVKDNSLVDDIKEVKDDICKETLACINCGRNYKIIKQELNLYKDLNIALPRECPGCRHQQRLALMGERTLFERQCQCGNIEHKHAESCPNKFTTKYQPGRPPEKVYCEECYKKEIY